ncbi:MAG: hypothetical protein ACUVV6_03625 [Thermoplasmatota archaeon]
MVGVLIWLSLSPPDCSGGDAGGLITAFSNGSVVAIVYFPEPEVHALVCLTVPRSAHILSASLWLRGLAGQKGEYPQGATLNLGADDSLEWSFSDVGVGGEMGRQVLLSSGSEEARLSVGVGEEGAAWTSFALPGDAKVTSASLELSGEERVVDALGAPLPLTACTPLGWSPTRRAFLLYTVLNSTLFISALDPLTGATEPVVELRLGPSGAVALKYDPLGDIVALLSPGEGVTLINLTSGVSRELLRGAPARSITAMELGAGWLAAAGPDWVGAVDTLTGDVCGISLTAQSGTLPGAPLSLDYDPLTRRAVIASGAAVSSEWALSVVDLGNGSTRTFTYRSSFKRSDPISVALLPGSEAALVGLSGDLYQASEVATPVTIVDLRDGFSSSRFPAMGQGFSMGIVLEGASLASMARASGGAVLTIVNLSEESWRSYPISLPDEAELEAWALDMEGERLLVAGGDSALWLFELRRGRARPVLWPPEVASYAVECAATDGRSLYVGTARGVASFNLTTWELEWAADCGAVGALATAPGLLAAASLEGWHLEEPYGLWRSFGLRVTVIELPGPPARTRSWSTELPLEWWDCRPTALALDPSGGRAYIGLAGKSSAAGLLELDIATGRFAGVATPTPFVSALALQPGAGRLMVGCRGEGGGLYILNLTTARGTLLSPISMPPILNTEPTSLCVDELGRVLVGHAATSSLGVRCLGGVTVLSPGLTNATFVYAGSDPSTALLDVAAIACDPRGERVFIAQALGGDLLALSSSLEPRPLWGVAAPPGSFVRGGSLLWDTGTRTLVCAAGTRMAAHRWTGELPENVTLDVGGDGYLEWASDGRLSTSVITDLAEPVRTALERARGVAGTVEIALRITSSTPGQVRLRGLSVVYEAAHKVELTNSLRAYIASRPLSDDVVVPVQLSSAGGGLELFNISVAWTPNSPPAARKPPELRVDAASPTAEFLDLGGCFRDDHTPPAELSYSIVATAREPRVRVSLVLSRYLMVEAHESSFRGRTSVRVEARDPEGLSTILDIAVVVEGSGDYIPPPPAYSAFLWVACTVLLAISLWATLLFLRTRRRGG